MTDRLFATQQTLLKPTNLGFTINTTSTLLLVSLQIINMKNLLLLSSLFLCALSTVLAGDVVLDFRAGESARLGVFYQGDQESPTLDVEVDHFKGYVEPMGHNTQYMKTGEAFVVRSQDFSLRVKVIVWDNTDPLTKEERPYKLTLKNLLMDQALQVKLSDKGGYIWIEEGTYITQLTDVQHDYEFLTNSGELMLAIRLFNSEEDEF